MSGRETSQPAARNLAPLVVVGSSTGGPGALATLLQGLPADLPMSMVIVQHIPEAQVPSLIERLASKSKLPVFAAQDGMLLSERAVHVAPGGRRNLLVAVDQGIPSLVLENAPHEQTYFPSIDRLFQSAARTFGRRTIGVLLTGMGTDGAIGMKAIADAGGITMAQSEETSVVFGMPRHAIDSGVVQMILPLERMAHVLWGQVLSLEGAKAPSASRKRVKKEM